ncbi:hypothetical protein ABVT39_013136 [Epinephelus coioides]
MSRRWRTLIVRGVRHSNQLKDCFECIKHQSCINDEQGSDQTVQRAAASQDGGEEGGKQQSGSSSARLAKRRDAEISENILLQKSFAPISVCFHCTFPVKQLRRAVIGSPHLLRHAQVTSKQSCHDDDDGTSLCEQSADSWSSRAAFVLRGMKVMKYSASLLVKYTHSYSGLRQITGGGLVHRSESQEF